jgi:hypothetical protein
MSWSAIALLATFASAALPQPSAGQEPAIQWFATHAELNEKGRTLALGDSVYVLQLRAGWSCTVGATSKNLPAYEVRTTSCRKGQEAFEFTVQCEPTRPRDHTQIRFPAPRGGFADFIEVACELRGEL